MYNKTIHMKGKTEMIECQICHQPISFGRIFRHINAQHKEITNQEYINLYWQTLPLYKPCEVCGKNIVYKYHTCSKECRSKFKHAHKGVPKHDGFMTKEHRDKISKSMMGSVGRFTGHHHSDETKKKARERMLGNPGYFTGHKHTKESKEIISQTMLAYYAAGNEPWTKNNKHTPETVERILKGGLCKDKNKLEQIISNLLDENEIKYTYSFFLRDEMFCRQYDFKIKGLKLLVEVDGDYWHGNPETSSHHFSAEKNRANDLFKDELAKENGYQVVRFWEKDIKEYPENIIPRIKEAINECSKSINAN